MTLDGKQTALYYGSKLQGGLCFQNWTNKRKSKNLSQNAGLLFFFFFSPWDTKWGRWWPPSCWWWLNIVPSITSVEMSALWQYWKGISVHWDGGFDSGRVRQLASLVFRKAGARSKPFIYHWKRFLFFCWALDLADTFFSEWESKLFVDTVICFLPDKPLLFSSSVPCKKFSEVYKICLWISEITFWFD